MGIFVSSQADLIAMINVASGVTFTASDLVFGTPRTATPDEVTQFGKNTAVPVRASATTTLVSGSTTFFYDRLDMKTLELFDLTTCSCGDGLAKAAWAPVVISYLNIPFDPTHLVDRPSSTVEGKVTVLIEATSNSLGWFGSGSLKFGGYPDIATAFRDNHLLGF